MLIIQNIIRIGLPRGDYKTKSISEIFRDSEIN